MIRRALLLAIWALVGTAASYAALYAFTPYGVSILLACLGVALVLPAAGGDRMPEALGLFAGPGLFAILIAKNSDFESAYWYAAGAVIVGAVLAAYVLVGRARCAARTSG